MLGLVDLLISSHLFCNVIYGAVAIALCLTVQYEYETEVCGDHSSELYTSSKHK